MTDDLKKKLHEEFTKWLPQANYCAQDEAFMLAIAAIGIAQGRGEATAQIVSWLRSDSVLDSIAGGCLGSKAEWVADAIETASNIGDGA